MVYDNAGNLTAHPNITTGSGSMAYDANNKMTAFAKTGVSVATTYDAAARRVRKVYNSETTVWVYDAFGKLAAEYTTDSHTDVATYFRTTDHLGSTRLTTDAIGDVVARRDFFPFGERTDSNLSGRGSVLDGMLVSFNSSPGMRQRFTGQQRDEETGLDYFWARKFFAPLGRFLSIDPGNADAKLEYPQSWSAFGYVSHQPLRYTDPLGLYSAEGCFLDPTSDELAETVYICPDVPGSGTTEPHTVTATDEPTTMEILLDAGLDFSSSGQFGASGSAASSDDGSGSSDTGGGGGGQNNETHSPRNPPNEERCEAARAILELEENYGTNYVALVSGNTWGDHTLEPFNSSYYAHPMTDYGYVDVDWFTDVTAASPPFGDPIVHFLGETRVVGSPRVGRNRGRTVPV